MPKPPKPPSGADVDAYAKWIKAQEQKSGAAFRAWVEAQKKPAPPKSKKNKMGAPRKYPPPQVLQSIAVDLLKLGVDDTLDWFCERVREECGLRRIKLPRALKHPKRRNRTIANAVGDLYWNAKNKA
jgi:hypothetical protein